MSPAHWALSWFECEMSSTFYLTYGRLYFWLEALWGGCGTERGDQARGHGSPETDLCRFYLVLGPSVSLCLLSKIASLWCDPVTTRMLAVGIFLLW